MARYNLFREISALCVMEKTGEHQYNKMIQSGELAEAHCDYGVGYYDVCIFYTFVEDSHYCRVWFGTVDDGDFGAFTECKTKEKAIALVEKAKDVFAEMVSCPSYDKLNLMFRELGIYFHHE